MTSFNFKKWNTILGWFAFAIALLTYSLTVEPTLSFWDCGEYIATSANLEVGHPPGAPLFQMLGAFFAMFAFSPDKIALMVNYLSVFSSAFTVLFMFWSLTMLLKKIAGTSKEISTNQNIMILGSAFIASLSFTFSSEAFSSNATLFLLVLIEKLSFDRLLIISIQPQYYENVILFYTYALFFDSLWAGKNIFF